MWSFEPPNIASGALALSAESHWDKPLIGQPCNFWLKSNSWNIEKHKSKSMANVDIHKESHKSNMVFQKGSIAKVFIVNSRSFRNARHDDSYELWSQGSRVFLLKASVVCSAHQTQSFPELFLQVVCIIRPDVRSWRLAPKCLHEAFRCAAHCNAHYERAAGCWHILNYFQICRLGFLFKYFTCAKHFRMQCFIHYAGREALEKTTWYLSESVCQQNYSP